MGKPDGEEDCREDCNRDPEGGGSRGALKLLWRGCTVEGRAGSGHHGLLLPLEPVPVPSRWQTWKS